MGCLTVFKYLEHGTKNDVQRAWFIQYNPNTLALKGAIISSRDDDQMWVYHLKINGGVGTPSPNNMTIIVGQTENSTRYCKLEEMWLDLTTPVGKMVTSVLAVSSISGHNLSGLMVNLTWATFFTACPPPPYPNTHHAWSHPLQGCRK